MTLIAELLLIAAICVFIVDVSGWTQTWKGMLARWTHASSAEGRLRPFDCSLCCTWWAGLLWCLFTGQFSLGAVAGCALAAASSRIILSAWNLICSSLVGLLDWLQRVIEGVFYD